MHIRLKTNISSAVCAFLLGGFGLGCGGEEPPTEERLLAEKFGRLVEAEGEKLGGKVGEGDLSLWESEFSKLKSKHSAEDYETWKKCIENAQTYADTEPCFEAIDPQDPVEVEVEQPKTIDEVCASTPRWASRDDPKFTLQTCHNDMDRLRLATGDDWSQFADCAIEARDILAFRTCQTDALPSAESLCKHIESVRLPNDDILTDALQPNCMIRYKIKSEGLNLRNQVDFSCCIRLSESASDVLDCLEANVPKCERPSKRGRH